MNALRWPSKERTFDSSPNPHQNFPHEKPHHRAFQPLHLIHNHHHSPSIPCRHCQSKIKRGNKKCSLKSCQWTPKVINIYRKCDSQLAEYQERDQKVFGDHFLLYPWAPVWSLTTAYWGWKPPFQRMNDTLKRAIISFRWLNNKHMCLPLLLQPNSSERKNFVKFLPRKLS